MQGNGIRASKVAMGVVADAGSACWWVGGDVATNDLLLFGSLKRC